MYCNDGSNGGLLAQVSQSANTLALDPSKVDLLYFWRAATELQPVQGGEIRDPDETTLITGEITAPPRPADGSNLACFDDVFGDDDTSQNDQQLKFFRASGYMATAYPSSSPSEMALWECEKACKDAESCRAYSYDLETSMCVLYKYYKGWTSKLQGVLGIKFGGEGKWSLPEPQTLPPVPLRKRQQLPASRKGDRLVGGWEWDGQQVRHQLCHLSDDDTPPPLSPSPSLPP